MEIDKGRFSRIVHESFEERKKVRRLVNTKRWQEAETDRNRFARYAARRRTMALPRGAEAMVGETYDLQAAWYLPEGAQVRRAVAYVEVTNSRRSTAGSGFLVSPELFLTNQHVVADEQMAFGAQITFDREIDDSGRLRPITSFTLDPGRFALFSMQEELDFALIAVGSRSVGAASLAELGYIILSDRPDKHAIGMNVNIIQHPLGLPKMVAVRNSILTHRTTRTLLYETDTDHGSSGSPVLNDDWELVALHHWGEPFLERNDDQGMAIPKSVNEGVRISEIYKELERRLPELPSDRQSLLRMALSYGKNIEGQKGGKRLSPPRPSTASAEGYSLREEETHMSEPNNGQELRFVLPIEVTVKVGTPREPGIPMNRPEAPKRAATGNTLRQGAEKLPIDQDYSNRPGYVPDFIVGLNIPLPSTNAKLTKQVAPLRAGEVDAEGGELKYQHFSIKMSKSRRIAIFTATNIDGNSYLNVDRDTGEVTDEASEGETWYKDPRISASFFLDQTFYSAWSNYFDRGHLTRRIDPNWGSKEDAERANADTYHFTNCSPQHFRFNESTKFWQGVERYVLENGALAKDTKNRISVMQGPIFDDKIDLWSDDVQIPSSFFKVVVWKGKSGEKSLGLVVDQLPLLAEERKNLGKPKPADLINVSQWRVGIKSIEQRTGLDFGDNVRNADTINQGRQPNVGEAQILIKSFSDLLPK